MKEKAVKVDKAKKNKSYPNSTIAEALCEIHFSSNEKFDQNKIDDLKHTLKNTYPNVNEDQIKHYRATVGESGLLVKEETTKRTIFKHKERNHLLQIFPGVLTVNEVGLYPSWDVFINDIKMGYTALSKTFPISSINRIGLRYINLIPRTDLHESLFNWFNPNKYYPDGLLTNTSGFLSRSEFSIENDKKLTVTLSESLQQSSLGSIVFDIDVISTAVQRTDYEFILSLLDSLHVIASDVFHTSISKKYETLLNGD